MATKASPPTLYTHPTEGWTLRGDAAASYLRMRAAGMPAGGVQVFHRTLAKQAELYARYRKYGTPVAAKPSPTAPHVRGVAMDLTTTVGGSYRPSSAFLWMVAGSKGNPSKAPENTTDVGTRAQAYGWYRTVPSERWHFGYRPELDTKVTAALKQRLRELGYPTVRAFQTAKGLTVDRKAGPQTWTALLTSTPPKPGPPTTVPVPKPAYRDFRFGWANLQAGRWKGLPDNSPKRGEFLRTVMKCSVYGLCETNEVARDAIRDELGGAARWKVYPVNYVTTLWDEGNDWTHLNSLPVEYGTQYHGAVRAALVDTETGIHLDVIAHHGRPNAAIPGSGDTDIRGKLADTRKMLTLVRPGVATIIAGDFNTKQHAELLKGAGFTRATPEVDTVDEAGDQMFDAVWVRGVTVRGHTLIDPGAVTDHKTWVVNLTLGQKPATS